MVVVACCLYPTFALSDTISTNAGEVVVMPANPTPTDSILLVYYYTSTDGCPDYNLALDSVVNNKVYVSRKKIDNGDRMCTTVITKFKSIINLGVLKANSFIYFDGKLVKTITPPCVMDKTGIVVAGTNDCLGRLFIEDTSSPVMSPLPQLYAFENNVIVNGTSTSKLKVGDKVKFGSNSILNNSTSKCKIVGIANCVEIIQVTPPPPPPCLMDKKGIVVYGENECASKIFIQEYSPISSAKQLYLIQNNGVTNGIASTSLKVGNEVKFGGYLIKADSAKVYVCGIVGIATCFEITETPPPCVMDKTGFVFEINDNMCLIKESNTSPDIYAIQGAKFAVGTKIQFKGVKITCITTPCYNIVVCYKVLETPPCIMDKTGVVVAGIDGCTGRLFILENSGSGTSPRMYSIQVKSIRPDGSSSIVLKVGDKVKFGAYPNSNDGNSILCPTVGVASCYELMSLENTFALTGTVMAGNDLMKLGLAYLFKKGETKACASNTIQNGVFKFTNLPLGEYTVYVIPSINVYKTYLPTFYTNKFLFSEADYISLDKNVLDIVVKLNQFELPKGIGKISGNISYANNSLKDSIFATYGLEKPLMPDMNKVASYIPVSLLNDFNEAVAWAISDSLGNYTFDNIPLDNYIVASETASAKGESSATLNTNKTTVNADIILKSPADATGLRINKDIQVSIYPNPASNKVIISLKESNDINIYNTMGQLMLSQQLKEGKNILNISSLDKGVCFLKIGNSTFKLFKE